MRRLKRLETQWHVVLRGARRLQLFRDEEDYLSFYRFLEKALNVSGVHAIAHCLMSNHLHLLLNGSSDQLAKCMHRADRAYSGYHNEKYDLSGHAFEQSYFCRPVASPFFLARVARYIHLNPFRAGIVTGPEDYRWSNYRSFISRSADYLPCRYEAPLSYFDPIIDVARKKYRLFVQQDMPRVGAPKTDGKTASEVWTEQFQWILDYVSEAGTRLAPMKVVDVAVFLGLRAGIPARVMGKSLGQENGRTVSKIGYRFSQMLEKNPDRRSLIASLGVL